jgi:xylono-1,5-lactonase
MAVDSAGCVWIALFGGSRIERYAASGELLSVVPFPCSNITKLAFGGDDLCTVFVTTARKGLSPKQLANEPTAGAIFTFHVTEPGLPQYEFSAEVPSE